MRMLSPAPLAVAAIVLATTLVAAHVREQTPTWPREPEQPSAPKPELPFRDWFLLIGEYESAPAPGRLAVHLYVLERDARLMVIADRGPARDVNTMAPRPVFTRDAARRATALTIGGVVHRRLQVGPEGGSGQLRVTPIRPVAEVLKESQSQTPPVEAGSFLPADLVELTSLDPTITLDVRYATTNNFLGSVFYAEARAFMQRPAAEALVRVQRALAPLGYGLLVHDGYRPWYVTKTFWETTPADRKWLVANPAQGSRHNRGAAVDLTLYDLKTGAVIEMPSTYDESTPRAYAFYPGGTSLQRWHRALLRRLVEAEGFAVNPEEWWHFDHQDWRRYAIGNLAFDRSQPRPAPGAAVAQTAPGAKPALPVLARFDGIYVWKLHVDWAQPSRTALTGPRKIAVAPYRYLCGGELTSCVPQPGVDRRLDAPGDPQLFQQSTHAPGGSSRWTASPAMDRRGNIGIGYSFGDADHFPGQQFAARLADDPTGTPTFHESVLAEGAASDSTRIGAFRLPGRQG